jgi:hypothetical protein
MTLSTTTQYAPTLQGQLLKLYTEVANPELRRRIARQLVGAYFAKAKNNNPTGERVYYIDNCYWFTLPPLQANGEAE